MQYACISLIALAIFELHAGIGGARMLYSYPAYGIIGLAALLTAFAKARRVGAAPRVPSLVSTLLLAGYVAVRIAFAPVEFLARPDHFMVLAALAVYLISVFFLSESRHRVAVVTVFLVLAAIHVACGVIQFKEGDNFMLLNPWIIRIEYQWRASGLYICPNHLAGLLEMLGLIALSLACWSRYRLWARLAFGYATFVCFLGVALTGSRGGYLSTVVGLAIFAILSLAVTRRVRRRYFWRIAWAVGLGFLLTVGGGLTLMFKSQTLKTRVGQVYEPNNMRLLMWGASLKQFALAPAIGTGSGTYLYYGRQFRSKGVQNDPMHVHNDYLELLCEYGVVGAVLMAAFLGTHLARGYAGLRQIIRQKLEPARRASSNELAMVLGTLAAIGALLVHSVVDFNVHIPGNAMILAFLFSILAMPMFEASRSDPSARRLWPTLWARFLTPGVGAYLILVAVPLIPGEYFAERARVALRDHDYPAAVGFAERGLARESKNPDLYFYLGEANHFLGLDPILTAVERARLAEVEIGALQTGLALFPQDLRLLLNLGRSLDQHQRFEEADQIFNRALDADPNFHNTYAYYGLHLQLQRKWSAAEIQYRKALSLTGQGNPIASAGLKDIERTRRLESEFANPDVTPNEDGAGEEAVLPDSGL